ncbi:hypothetical protein ANCCAN_09414 [Ancylostoma caninum]|uniref:Uncharacterized protein n=1 Tax=Ancylostoma caninum TaxID=29170 RepID=A0A368GJR0_ANCCA|nr:hypothetical protein ANCCAN_09414 [Ancylostoma caninum]
MTLMAKAINQETKKIQPVSVLLDTGSHYSYIREDTAKRLNLQLSRFKPCSVLAFEGKSTVEQSAKTAVTLVDVHGNKFNIKVTTRTFITTVCRNTITNSNSVLENIHGEKTMEVSIDILLPPRN